MTTPNRNTLKRLPHFLVLCLLIEIGALAATPTTSDSAVSSTCQNGPSHSRWYAQGLILQENITGSDVWITAKASKINFPTGETYGFINQDMWQLTGNGGTKYWAEELLQHRQYISESVGTTTFLWADNRPGNGYSQHDITTVKPKIRKTYSLAIWAIGNNRWEVALGDTLQILAVNLSVDNGNWGDGVAAGIESTNDKNTMGLSSFMHLKYRSQSDNKWHKWQNMSGQCNKPGVVYITEPTAGTYGRIDSSFGSSAANLVDAATNLETPNKPESKIDLKVEGVNQTAVDAAAQTLADVSDSSDPITGSYVECGRQQAISFLSHGEQVNSNESVFVFAFKGSFSAKNLAASHGQNLLGGQAIVVVDKATKHVIDVMVTNTAPSLNGLGKTRPVTVT